MALSTRQIRYLAASVAAGAGLAVLLWRGSHAPNRDAFPTHPDAAFQRGECTWYVYQRAQDNGWRVRFDHPYGRNARAWPERVVGARLAAEPAAGSILVFDAWPGNPYGHVAYVESVSAGSARFTISHANFGIGTPLGKRQDVEVFQADCEMAERGVRLNGGRHVYAIRGFLRPIDQPVGG